MADKKLLEESVIERFQKLANIPKTSKGMLSEGTTKVKLSGQEPAGGRSAAPMASQGVRGPVREAEMEDEEIEEGWMKEEDEGAPEADDAGMDAMAGDDMGADMEGGDLESAVSTVVDALNGLLDAAGLSDKKVEMDSGEEGEEMEAPEAGEEMSAELPPMMEKKEKEEDEEEEELDESIELVDDALIEKLVQRVSARLVAEARKARELAEGKKGSAGNWLSKPSHSKPPKAKGSPKGKTGAPFNKSVSTKGLAGRGK